MENDLEQQLRSVLNDPSAMQNIMAVAQSLSGSVGTGSGDSEMIPMQRLASLVSDHDIDQRQSSLLSALSPYLSNDRLRKLEKAMRASKVAKLASTLIAGSR